MNLNPNYELLWMILKWFFATAIVVIAGIVVVKGLFSDIEDKVILFLQTIKDLFDAFRD